LDVPVPAVITTNAAMAKMPRQIDMTISNISRTLLAFHAACSIDLHGALKELSRQQNAGNP
jgi:hypothetical protein